MICDTGGRSVTASAAKVTCIAVNQVPMETVVVTATSKTYKVAVANNKIRIVLERISLL
jgi:hypothetical protein